MFVCSCEAIEVSTESESEKVWEKLTDRVCLSRLVRVLFTLSKWHRCVNFNSNDDIDSDHKACWRIEQSFVHETLLLPNAFFVISLNQSIWRAEAVTQISRFEFDIQDEQLEKTPFNRNKVWKVTHDEAVKKVYRCA